MRSRGDRDTLIICQHTPKHTSGTHCIHPYPLYLDARGPSSARNDLLLAQVDAHAAVVLERVTTAGHLGTAVQHTHLRSARYAGGRHRLHLRGRTCKGVNGQGPVLTGVRIREACQLASDHSWLHARSCTMALLLSVWLNRWNTRAGCVPDTQMLVKHRHQSAAIGVGVSVPHTHLPHHTLLRIWLMKMRVTLCLEAVCCSLRSAWDNMRACKPICSRGAQHAMSAEGHSMPICSRRAQHTMSAEGHSIPCQQRHPPSLPPCLAPFAHAYSVALASYSPEHLTWLILQ